MQVMDVVEPDVPRGPLEQPGESVVRAPLQRGAGERSEERADHAPDDRHGHAHHGAHDPADERAPRRPAGAAERPREPKSQPPLDDFAQERQAQDDRDGRDADRAEVREPAVADDAGDHDPQTGQAEGNEHEPEEGAHAEQQSRKGVTHRLQYRIIFSWATRVWNSCARS